MTPRSGETLWADRQAGSRPLNPTPEEGPLPATRAGEGPFPEAPTGWASPMGGASWPQLRAQDPCHQRCLKLLTSW